MEIIEQRQYCWETAIPFSTVFITFILVYTCGNFIIKRNCDDISIQENQ